ncbi:NAD-dependent protein deacetylase [Glutamicibacter uratoxydans]|uniref:protein acetyllysine N-acetyltransferase n=1 Tax=Glutamicibacter uratoxydans TaxID=43667 RepID=A0A4Y4DJ41_GLUUR|nr:Sir2 family NAD-dependent protein deacetylase [Glutamicibacter uratoxydans]GED05282.1 NAD-dependent protein deacetylase [Glutamicibacter uratoxydans]
MSTPEELSIQMAHHSAIRSMQRIVQEQAEADPEPVARDGVQSLLDAGKVLVVTGAGVSTDSGIPDYRGPNGSLQRHRPMTYQEFRYRPEARQRYWARGFVGWRHMDKAKPNDIHRRLVQWEREGRISGIITQNVDGLHQQAGSRRVVPVHGDLSIVRCLDCGYSENRQQFDARLQAANVGYLEAVEIDPSAVNPDGDVELPQYLVDRFVMVHCMNCGSEVLKPDVVYFGESVPAERKEAMHALESESSSLLVLGSSLAVMSGYRILLDFVKRGLPVALVTNGHVRGEEKATWRWRVPLDHALSQLR